MLFLIYFFQVSRPTRINGFRWTKRKYIAWLPHVTKIEASMGVDPSYLTKDGGGDEHNLIHDGRIGQWGEGGWAMGDMASLTVSNSSYDTDVHDEELVTGSAPLGVGVALEDLIYKQAFQSGRKKTT